MIGGGYDGRVVIMIVGTFVYGWVFAYYFLNAIIIRMSLELIYLYRSSIHRKIIKISYKQLQKIMILVFSSKKSTKEYSSLSLIPL